MPTLAVINFNIVCAVLGGFITLFGLVSYLLKERFYLSEACRSSPPLLPFTTDHISDIVAGWSHLLSARNKLHQAP